MKKSKSIQVSKNPFEQFRQTKKDELVSDILFGFTLSIFFTLLISLIHQY